MRLCGLQGRDRPSIERRHIAVFAADHDVAEEGVSAFTMTEVQLEAALQAGAESGVSEAL